jgi:type II secretory pathway pseudopilin PulG
MRAAGKFRRSGSRRDDEGYILLTLMFMCTLIIVGLAAIGPQLSQQLKRDREEEMIHRGVQYSRAIRKFYKKTGRYPVRLEELENTNNLRFIRKKYKDPITGEDFKLLHFGEVKSAFGGGIAGATMPGVNAATLAAGIQGANNPQAQAQAMLASQMQTQIVAQMAAANASNPQNLNGSDSSDSSSSGNSGSSSKSSNPAFGGGPIVGVVSTSTKESIRQFNKKNHYNDWQFIYDPNTDRGGLLNTPAQPVKFNQNVAGTGPQSGVPGVPTLGGAGGMQASPQPVQPAQPQPPADQSNQVPQ